MMRVSSSLPAQQSALTLLCYRPTAETDSPQSTTFMYQGLRSGSVYIVAEEL